MDKYIYYARVSTNSIEQIESLKSQIQKLNDAKKQNKNSSSIIMKEIKSISNGMSVKLKKCITDEMKGCNVIIIVMNFDRLVRDFADIKFLRSNVSHIISINEQKEINLSSNWKDLLQYIVFSVEEIDKFKLRTSQYKDNKKSTKRSIDEQLHTSNKRCKAMSNLISDNKYDSIVDDVSQIIRMSQNLTSKKNWKNMSYIAEEYGVTSILDDYYNNIDKQKQKDIQFNLTRNDILGYVKNIFNYLHIKIDDVFLKEFVNSNVSLGRKCAEYNIPIEKFKTNDIQSNISPSLCDMDDIINILETISSATGDKLNTDDIEKIQNFKEQLKTTRGIKQIKTKKEQTEDFESTDTSTKKNKKTGSKKKTKKPKVYVDSDSDSIDSYELVKSKKKK